jgi:hypothetical protein
MEIDELNRQSRDAESGYKSDLQQVQLAHDLPAEVRAKMKQDADSRHAERLKQIAQMRATEDKRYQDELNAMACVAAATPGAHAGKVDPELVGIWSRMVNSPTGTGQMMLDIAPRGTYVLYDWSNGSRQTAGTFDSSGRFKHHFKMISRAGQVTEGDYAIRSSAAPYPGMPPSKTLSMTSDGHTTTWTQSSTQSQQR